MAQTIDMQSMRYLNLFAKISHVHTTNCFSYNNVLIFAVPKAMVSKAIGPKAANIKKLSEVLRRKVKIIAKPLGDSDVAEFIKSVIEPTEFNSLEVKDGTVLISAGRQNKAMLIGRNRIREKELTDILARTLKINKLRIL